MLLAVASEPDIMSARRAVSSVVERLVYTQFQAFFASFALCLVTATLTLYAR
jgi:hypothetical protein